MTTPRELCVGWDADPACPVYGAMHGCALDDDHRGAHICKCGMNSRGQQTRLPKKRPPKNKPKPRRAAYWTPAQWAAHRPSRIAR